MAKFLHMSDYQPPIRMMALVGWARVASNGEMHAGCEKYDVLRVINVMIAAKGNLILTTDQQICIDGELMTLRDAKENHLPPSTVCEVVVCPWERHLDQDMLGGTLESLRRLAVDLLNNEDGIGDPEEEESEEKPFNVN